MIKDTAVTAEHKTQLTSLPWVYNYKDFNSSLKEYKK